MDEREKLKMLLEHWIEHNQEHSEEFREWAGKAKDAGQAAVHDGILEAARQLDKANDSLRKALAGLEPDQS